MDIKYNNDINFSISNPSGKISIMGKDFTGEFKFDYNIVRNSFHSYQHVNEFEYVMTLSFPYHNQNIVISADKPDYLPEILIKELIKKVFPKFSMIEKFLTIITLFSNVEIIVNSKLYEFIINFIQSDTVILISGTSYNLEQVLLNSKTKLINSNNKLKSDYLTNDELFNIIIEKIEFVKDETLFITLTDPISNGVENRLKDIGYNILHFLDNQNKLVTIIKW